MPLNVPTVLSFHRDVEAWILDLYPSIVLHYDLAAHDLESSGQDPSTCASPFQQAYTQAAARAFFFFLDPRRLGRVS